MYFMNGIHKRPNPTKRTVVIRPTATSRCSLASGRSLRYTSHVSSVEQELNADASELISAARSEEHTSELQSPCNLVCRLLLEKKKKNKNTHELNRQYAARDDVLSLR